MEQNNHNNGNKNLENENTLLSNCVDVARQLISENDAKEREHSITHEGRPELAPRQGEIYQEVLHVLNAGHLNYAVGAGFARYVYTRIWRPTKDLDIYVKSQDLRYTLNLLSAAGFETEILEKHWLAKAWKEGYFIDLIFGTGHNQIVVDDDFLAGYKETEIPGVSTRLVAVEELIAAAAYIKERKRYDSADTMHLILATKGKIDWQRVLNRLGKNRQLLLVDLLLFGYIYPGHTDYLPHDLIQELFTSTQQLWSEDNIDPKICRGSILDPFSFTVDIKDWGYKDQRNIRPLVNGEGESV